MINYECIICGNKFTGQLRRNKKTCGDACRSQLARYRKQVKDKYWHLKEDVEVYEKMLDIDELHDDAYAVLESIMVKIARILEVQS